MPPERSPDTNKCRADRTILVAEDDKALREMLSRTLTQRGFQVIALGTIAESLAQIKLEAPAYAIVDLRLSDGNGLDIIVALRNVRPDSKALILTGYASIMNAVTATKMGVVNYLAKPADVEEIVTALFADHSTSPPLNNSVMSPDRMQWEYIHRVYELCGRNVSETARQLKMHRRTLQRMLAKRAPK